MIKEFRIETERQHHIKYMTMINRFFILPVIECNHKHINFIFINKNKIIFSL